MKRMLLLLATVAPCLAGDRVEFGGERYSLEFPQGWTKTEGPGADAELTRQSPAKDVMITVHADAIPEGTVADLDATAKTSAKSYAKAIRFEGKPRISDGTLDGRDAKFITLMPQDADEGPLAMFAVFIDTKNHLVRITATMQTQVDQETRDACLGIVKSFRREDAGSRKDGDG